MQNANALLYRVISGCCIVRVFDEKYLIKGTSAFQKYLAEEYFNTLIEENSELDEYHTEQSLYLWLIRNGFWKDENNQKLEKYKKDIEDLKVRLFELGFKGREKELTKKAITIARDNLTELVEKRHRYDFLTVEGSALIAKNKYLMALGIYKDDKPLFSSPEVFLGSDFPFLDNIIIEYNKNAISSETMRSLARSNQWRSYWCNKESDHIFGKPAIELTDDQLNLISWTRLYDNIYQHPDCPSEEVIEDDDALDGFLIFDKRKRDKEKGINVADSGLSDKIKRHEEVFIVADNPDDIRKIYNLNEDSARRAINKRDALIDKQGRVENQELDDIKLKRKLAINQKAMELARA